MSTSSRSLSGSFPRGPAIRAVLALGVAFLLSSQPVLAGRILPDRAAATSMQVTGQAFDVTQRAVRIRVEPLDAAQVADWFRVRTRSGHASLNLDASLVEPDDGSGEAPKPRARKRMAQPLMVFALSIENGSNDDVTYIPAMTSIFDQHEVEQSVLPADFVRELFRGVFSATPDPDAAADESMQAVHSDVIILKSGQRVSRLLVFPPADPKTKTATLYLRHVAIGQTEINPVFPFVVTE